MASIFGHAFVSSALSVSFKKSLQGAKGILLGVFCSILPDADVIGFKYNIAYGSFWGHRGFSHSLVFAVLLGLIIVAVFYRKSNFKNKGLLLIYFFLCTASHGLLDGLTTGGLGVAYFSPFDDTRYFLPWRPIMVSPIGVSSFFSARGLAIIFNELIWIGLPSLAWVLFNRKK